MRLASPREATTPRSARTTTSGAAATIERYTPLLRRLERLQFSPVAARRSVELHDRLIEACAAGDADGAARVTAQIWRTLEDLADDPIPTEPGR